MSKKRLFRVPNKGYSSSFDSLQAIGGLTLALDYRFGVFTDTALTTRAAIGQTVKGWQDRSGNGYHATEATNPPTLAADGLTFDGANDVLRVARMTGQFSAGFSYFVVATLVDGVPAATNIFLGASSAAPVNGYFQSRIASNGTYVNRVTENTTNLSAPAIQTFADGSVSTFIATITANPGATQQSYFNAVVSGSASLAGVAWLNIAGSITEAPFLGALNNNGSVGSPTACTIKSLLIYNRPLSTTELLTVHRYLGSQFSITVP